MKKILITLYYFASYAVVLTLIFVSTANAEFTNSKCSKVLTHSGDIQISRDYDKDSRVCFISIHPMNVTDLKYRDYYFNSQGLFLVFNSYGEGSDASSTGARVFYLFPVVNDYPDFSIEPNGDVIVRTVSGHMMTFNSEVLGLKNLNPGSFTEKPLSPSNKGGVEIKTNLGFWYDSGFRFGGMANERPSSKTQIIGGLSGQCSVKNSEIFNYTDDIVPKFTGSAHSEFLKKRCPEVKF